MQSYKSIIAENKILVLSTNRDFFEILKGMTLCRHRPKPTAHPRYCASVIWIGPFPLLSFSALLASLEGPRSWKTGPRIHEWNIIFWFSAGMGMPKL
jgi:hypothetical protein